MPIVRIQTVSGSTYYIDYDNKRIMKTNGTSTEKHPVNEWLPFHKIIPTKDFRLLIIWVEDTLVEEDKDPDTMTSTMTTRIIFWDELSSS